MILGTIYNDKIIKSCLCLDRMKGILKTMKSIKRMYVGRSGSGKSYECIELAKNHCNGITMIFAGIPIFKKEKDELRSCGFTFCDTKDLYELDPKKGNKYYIYNAYPSALKFHMFDDIWDFLINNIKRLNKKDVLIIFDEGVISDFKIPQGFMLSTDNRQMKMKFLSKIVRYFLKSGIVFTIQEEDPTVLGEIKKFNVLSILGTDYEVVVKDYAK